MHSSSDGGGPTRGLSAHGWALLVCLGLVTFAPHSALAQDASPTPTPRPLVGVALGGGSARGMAHAGVLLWLEEHRIPVDRIAGNSTGALMGAAYATGISAEEIKTLLRTADWDSILRADIPYAQKSYRRKEDDREYSVRIEAGLSHGFRLQSGLNPGHHLGLLISRILLPYSGVTTFDDLPIPFRCVATDLEKGEIVVFDRGPIAPAVRASMSLPGTYDPVRLDGRLFTDGGVLNNVPVDVARDMGAEVVIAVRVGPKAEEEVPETIAGVANRAITLMMQTMERPRLRRASVVIVPDLDGLTASDFRRSDEFAARGYQAAEAQKEKLLPYALDETAWAEYQAALQARRTGHLDPISFVEVTGARDGAGTQIASQLGRHIGRPPDPLALEADLSRIVGLGRYASATYGRREIESTAGLRVDIRDKSYGPPFVRFSLDVNNEGKDINLNLGSRVTLMDVTGLGSEWRIDGALGTTLSLGTELYQPIGGDRPVHGGAFFSPRAIYTRTSENLYRDSELVAIYGRQRAGAGLDIGWNSSGSTRFLAGYDVAYVRNVTRVGDPLLPRSTGAEHSLRARFDYDGRNAAYLPTQGVRFRSTAQWFMEAPEARLSFGTVQAAWDAARAVKGGRVFTLALEGGTTFGGLAPTLYQFSLGGAFRLGGFPPYALRGPRYALGSVGYRQPLLRLPNLLGGKLYADALVEAGSVFDRLSSAQVKGSFTAGLAADTLLGPFFAGGSLGHNGKLRVYFMMGRLVR
jgi:NTE family protein